MKHNFHTFEQYLHQKIRTKKQRSQQMKSKKCPIKKAILRCGCTAALLYYFGAGLVLLVRLELQVSVKIVSYVTKEQLRGTQVSFCLCFFSDLKNRALMLFSAFDTKRQTCGQVCLNVNQMQMHHLL